MTGHEALTSPPIASNLSLRVRGAVLFVAILAEILVGNELALAGAPYPVGYLAAHVVLSVLLVGFSGFATVIAFRYPAGAPRLAAAVTLLGALGATIAGTIFLAGGQSSSALVGMEALGGVALLGALLLVVFGGGQPAARAEPLAGSH